MRLLAAVARKHEFLTQSLRSACAVDTFTAQIMNLYLKAYQHRPQQYSQDVCLAIVRNDYMLHNPAGQSLDDAALCTVEFNTIAASLAALASLCTRLHRQMLTRVLRVERQVIDEQLPSNNNLDGIALGFKVGWCCTQATGLIDWRLRTDFTIFAAENFTEAHVAACSFLLSPPTN